MSDAMPERWLPVVGYEGLYEVSDLGRVRSLDRRVRNRSVVMTVRGRVLRRMLKKTGYWGVTLSKGGVVRHHRVHVLLMESFVGPRPAGMECRHLDCDRQNAVLSNLAYGTHAENMHDCASHRPKSSRKGVRLSKRRPRDTCMKGHAYTEENTLLYSRAEPDGTTRIERRCRICGADRVRAQRSRAALSTGSAAA